MGTGSSGTHGSGGGERGGGQYTRHSAAPPPPPPEFQLSAEDVAQYRLGWLGSGSIADFSLSVFMVFALKLVGTCIRGGGPRPQRAAAHDCIRVVAQQLLRAILRHL